MTHVPFFFFRTIPGKSVSMWGVQHEPSCFQIQGCRQGGLRGLQPPPIKKKRERGEEKRERGEEERSKEEREMKNQEKGI